MADENAKYERAKKRVDEIRGFYTHAIVYVCVNLVLFLINLFLSPGGWWFYAATWMGHRVIFPRHGDICL